MNLKSFVSIALCLTVMLFIGNYFSFEDDRLTKEQYAKYNSDFGGAVSDIAVYIGELESQQSDSTVHYNRDKRLAMDLEIVNTFYDNLAVRFGISGDVYQEELIKQHIPAMTILSYDGFRVAHPTIESTGYRIEIGEFRSYFKKLANNDVVYFRLDNTVKYYDYDMNNMIEATHESIFPYYSEIGVTNAQDMEVLKQAMITEAVSKEMAIVIGVYNENSYRGGNSYQFNLPGSIYESRFTDVGFMALMQGYPLPSGEIFSAFSFGASRITRGKEYIGTIRADGRHVAYEASCGLDPNTIVIETLYGEKEAAIKGYYVDPCN